MARVSIMVSAELPPHFTIPKWQDYVLAAVKSGLGWKLSDVGASVQVTCVTVENKPPKDNYCGDPGDAV
jgi:hypothetical protein